MSAATTMPARERPTLVSVATSARGATTETRTKTMRSASVTILPRAGTLAHKQDSANLVAVMKMNVDFLRSILEDDGPASAMDAIDDLSASIARLEQEFSSALPVGFRRTG